MLSMNFKMICGEKITYKRTKQKTEFGNHMCISLCVCISF